MSDLEFLRKRVEVARAVPPASVCRALREAAGVSQDDVAKAIGVSRATVGHWETGRRRPWPRHLESYMEALQVLQEAAS